MSKILAVCLFGLTLFGVPHPAVAAETLPSLLQEALAQHPSVRLRQSELRAADSDLQSARWGRFPSVGVTTQLVGGGDSQAVLRIEQPLWTAGRITGEIDYSSAARADAEAALGETRLELLEETASTFYELARLQARLQIALDNEAEHRRLLDTIRRRVIAQVNPAADQTLATSRLHQAVNERLTTERQLAMTRTRLEQIVNRSIGNVLAPGQISFEMNNSTDFEDRALDYSPTRRRFTAQSRQSAADIKLQRSQAFPAVVAGYERVFGDTDYSGMSRDRTYVGLQLQLGAGLSSYSRVQAAHARSQASYERIAAHERELRTTVQHLHAEITSLRAQEPAVRQMLVDADDIVESYIRQFQVGRKSWLDVLNVQREKAQAHYALTDLEYPLQLAQVRLLLWTDELNEHNLEERL